MSILSNPLTSPQIWLIQMIFTHMLGKAFMFCVALLNKLECYGKCLSTCGNVLLMFSNLFKVMFPIY